MISILKKKVLSLFYYSINSPQRVNELQIQIRDCEWEAIEKYIQQNTFLDVGCGAGYAMYKAQQLGCVVRGIDPEPRSHGVGRKDSDFVVPIEHITQGFSEQLPYSNEEFETVYCSHVIEHVSDINQSLQEIVRVAKNDGIIIIGVPTATLAWIHWIFSFIFLTHIKIVNIFFSKVIHTDKTFWWELFIPISHSYPIAKTILHDIKNYRISKWRNEITKYMDVQEVIKPCLYMYPDYIQIFSMKKNSRWSSSVFFICKKK